jgi:hypothetical protein
VSGSGPPRRTFSAPAIDEFLGTDRYQLQRRIGEGGMGVVFEALDLERKTTVALKTLRHVDPGAIFRLKQEFRSLADVSHPNLVGLLELSCVEGRWFFTMELIDGVNFLAFVREGYEVWHAATLEVSGDAPPPESGGSRLDVDRLRGALRQLATGVSALHQQGKLHRDIKPSNVLVTRQGRVVLLDFGLVTDAAPDHPRESVNHVVGTAAYMAPEQAASGALTPSADWYAVGAMLYEALTGRLPFDGTSFEILMRKQQDEPPLPSAIVNGVPPDLDKLCGELLRRRPEARPSSSDIQRRLGAIQSGPARVTSRSSASAALLVGRERHLEELLQAFRESAFDATCVFVHGYSGMGKSALVRRFLEIVRGEALVLTGRCYERESVPYKGFDRLVDELSTYLLSLSTADVRALLPRDVAALARVFPVLKRVAVLANARRIEPDIPDALELRRRAFAALRDLLARIGERERLVLYIDDLQWGDLDSAALLAELMRAPDAPPLLLVGCYRSEEEAASVMVRGLPRTARTRSIAIDRLTDDEARTLAAKLLDPHEPQAEAHAEAIAREAGGSPFFVGELVRYVEVGAGIPAGDLTLEKVLAARLERLPQRARHLLEVLALHGRPLQPELAMRAADLAPGEDTALAELRVHNLVRTRGASGQVEPYHDRIREMVAALLPAEDARRRHAGLAAALEAYEAADPELLSIHYRGAGDLERAGEWAAVAADQAAEALAFDRAARLYRQALAERPTGPNVQKLRVKLGDALVNAGRGLDAAAAYLEAREGAGPAESRTLERRAAEQLLYSGHIDEGRAHMREVLRPLGMDLARSNRQGLLELLYGRARLGLRGVGFELREPSQIPAEELERIDACWSLGQGFVMIDVVTSYAFYARHLRYALDAGEPYRIARGLAIEPAMAAAAAKFARADLRVSQARAVAEKIDNPHARGLVTMAEGVVRFMQGEFKAARALLEEAERVYRERCTGVAWDLATTQVMKIFTLFYLGELAAIASLLPDQIRHAEERGDLYAVLNSKISYASVFWLLSNDVDQARREAEDSIRRWSLEGFHVQHFSALTSHLCIDLYRGDGKAAWDRMESEWPKLASSMLLRVLCARVEAFALRGRSALAGARAGVKPDSLLRCAADQARNLKREKLTFTRGLGELLDAGVAASRKVPDAAARHLSAAIEVFDACSMAGFAAAARYQRGRIIGGDEGRALISASEELLRRQKVQKPDRLVAMLAPGFDDV